jgi:hypothetical protein
MVAAITALLTIFAFRNGGNFKSVAGLAIAFAINVSVTLLSLLRYPLEGKYSRIYRN